MRRTKTSVTFGSFTLVESPTDSPCSPGLTYFGGPVQRELRQDGTCELRDKSRPAPHGLYDSSI